MLWSLLDNVYMYRLYIADIWLTEMQVCECRCSLSALEYSIKQHAILPSFLIYYQHYDGMRAATLG